MGLPDSPGVPKAATATTLVAPYNDLEAVRKVGAQKGGAQSLGAFEAGNMIIQK